MKTTGFPLWVKIGLFGLKSRKGGLMWMALSIAASFMFCIYGSLETCGVFLLVALWYWLCIKWVDKNAKWED